MDSDHEDTLMKKKPMHLPKQQGTLCMTMKGNCCTCKPLTHVDCQVQTKEHDLGSVHILTACLVTSKTLQHRGDGGRGGVWSYGKEHDLSSVYMITAWLLTSKTLHHWGDGGKDMV